MAKTVSQGRRRVPDVVLGISLICTALMLPVASVADQHPHTLVQWALALLGLFRPFNAIVAVAFVGLGAGIMLLQRRGQRAPDKSAAGGDG